MLTSLQPTQALGRLKYGRPHGFLFQLRNQGSNPLEIRKVAVGCTSCTKATIKKTHLGPQEETEVSVVFTPGSTGPQTKSISVLYNADSSLKLEFTADVYA